MLSFITKIWDVLFNNVLAQPAIFIGLIVVVGYALLKRKWYEILAGFIRTVVGYMILQAGASLLKGTVSPLLNGIQQKWAIDAVVIDPNFGFTAANSALESIGITTSFAMLTLLIAFVWNIVLVFFQKIYESQNSVYNRSHHGETVRSGYLDHISSGSLHAQYVGNCSDRSSDRNLLVCIF